MADIDPLEELKRIAESFGLGGITWEFAGRAAGTGEQIWSLKVGRKRVPGARSDIDRGEFRRAVQQYASSKKVTLC